MLLNLVDLSRQDMLMVNKHIFLIKLSSITIYFYCFVIQFTMGLKAALRFKMCCVNLMNKIRSKFTTVLAHYLLDSKLKKRNNDFQTHKSL